MSGIYRLCLLSMVYFLWGCAGGSDLPYAQSGTTQTTAERFGTSSPTAEVVPERTPQWVASLKTPTLEVTLERSDRVAVLVPFSDRSDTTRGAVRVWRSADAAQIVLRGGVLIGTRGLGNDINSTLAQTMIAVVTSPAPVSGPHVLYTVTSENGIRPIHMMCSSRSVEDEVIDIVGRQIESRRVKVTCRSGAEIKEYDFWVDAHGSTVWQSRQWAGPELGYLRTTG
ncbi:MAG: YjbF family lipoprotein [Pseudomonadota bacterium]